MWILRLVTTASLAVSIGAAQNYPEWVPPEHDRNPNRYTASDIPADYLDPHEYEGECVSMRHHKAVLQVTGCWNQEAADAKEAHSNAASIAGEKYAKCIAASNILGAAMCTARASGSYMDSYASGVQQARDDGQACKEEKEAARDRDIEQYCVRGGDGEGGGSGGGIGDGTGSGNSDTGNSAGDTGRPNIGSQGAAPGGGGVGSSDIGSSSSTEENPTKKRRAGITLLMWVPIPDSEVCDQANYVLSDVDGGCAEESADQAGFMTISEVCEELEYKMRNGVCGYTEEVSQQFDP